MDRPKINSANAIWWATRGIVWNISYALAMAHTIALARLGSRWTDSPAGWPGRNLLFATAWKLGSMALALQLRAMIFLARKLHIGGAE
jgi:hypothetical protein